MAEGLLVGLSRSARRACDTFQGKKEAGFTGAFPLLAAQTSKYQLSHFRALVFKRVSMAQIENIIMYWFSVIRRIACGSLVTSGMVKRP